MACIALVLAVTVRATHLSRSAENSHFQIRSAFGNKPKIVINMSNDLTLDSMVLV